MQPFLLPVRVWWASLLLGFWNVLFIMSCIRSRQHPYPNHGSVRVPRAYGDQSIHAQTIVPFVFQEQTVTKASMFKLLA